MGKLRVDSMRRQAVGPMLIALGVALCAGFTAAAGLARAGVPAHDAQAPAPAGDGQAPTKKSAPVAPIKLIDINSASRAELKTLPGIGDAEVDRIVAARPYLSKVHLVSDAGLPIGTYQSIRHQIAAVQNKPARAKLKSLASASQAQPR